MKVGFGMIEGVWMVRGVRMIGIIGGFEMMGRVVMVGGFEMTGRVVMVGGFEMMGRVVMVGGL